MKTLLLGCAAGAGLLLLVAAGVLFLWPRPPDTTDVRLFQGDARAVDHCALPVLDGRGRRADDIPRAFTPGCGWTRFPLPVLAGCREPLPPGVPDLRGLWIAEDGPAAGHVERIEQCGDRVVVTSSGVIHDFRTDGTLARGSRDVEPPLCINTWAAVEWVGDVLRFRPFGLPFTIVTRRMDGDELVWTYPRFEGEVRMKRICRVPDRLAGAPASSVEAPEGVAETGK
jgi:hypothetical protein